MARIPKFFKIVFHLAFIYSINHIINQKPMRATKKIERLSADIRHLLLWTEFPGFQDEGQHIFINRSCRRVNCYLTSNRNYFADLRYFDAIIFNVKDVSKKSWDLPRIRSGIQKYIFAANDSADNFPVCNRIFDDYFNWTWTYRTDSSIPYKLISVYNRDQEELGNNFHWIRNMKSIDKLAKSLLQSKSKAAAIFLDKCNTTNKREDFLKRLQVELAKYNLTVDVFGKCGTKQCARKSMNACYYRLKTTYYFYLAFEDSNAPDYITKAVLNGYMHNAVPIVYGGAKYTKFLPPDSYLDASLLGESMLAKEMFEIIHNKEWYQDFFRWKNHYVIKEAAGMDPCVLCDVMNHPAWLETQASYVQFRQWWNTDYRFKCSTKMKYFTV